MFSRTKMAVALALLVAGCGARTSLSQGERLPEPPPIVEEAGVDGGVDDDGGVDAGIDAPVVVPPSPAICALGMDAGANVIMDCGGPLVVESLTRSSVGCFVDTVVAVGKTGMLSYPCAGGRATIVIGGRTFAGVVVGDTVDTCDGTSFTFSDGCMWNSAQHVTGSLSSGVLSFSYAEQPVAGQTNCLPPCSATGTVRLE